MFVPHATVDAAVAALDAGKPVLVVGGWGCGKSALLRAIASRLDAGRVLVVDDAADLPASEHAAVASSIRAGQPAALAFVSDHDVPPRLHRAWLDADGSVVRLGRLDAHDAAAVLAAHGIDVDMRRVLAIGEQAGGIPRLVLAVASGADIAALVAGLRGSLDPVAQRAFDVLAVSGGLPIAAAERVVDLAGLDRLVALGVADRPGADGDLSLAAPVVAAAAARALPMRRRRALLRAIVTACIDTDPAEPSLRHRVRRAEWSAELQGDLAIVADGLQAAVIAADTDAMIALGRHIVGRDPHDLRSAHCLAIGYEAAGDHAAAADVDRLVRAADPVWRSRTASNRYFATRGVHGEVVATDDPTSEATANVAWLHLFAGDVVAAQRVGAEVLATPSSTPQALVWAAVAHAASSVLRGDAAADAALDDVAPLVGASGVNAFAPMQVGLCRAFVQIRSGQAAEAHRRAVIEADTAAAPLVRAVWHGFALLAARETGCFRRALEHGERCLDGIDGDPFGLATWARSELAVCHAMLGEAPPAVQVTGSGEPAPPVALVVPVLARNESWSLAAAGRVDDARAAARTAAAIARQQGQLTDEVLALVDLARFGRPREALQRVRTLDRFENAVVRVGAQAVAALAEPDAARLHAAALASRAIAWGVLDDELALSTMHALRRRNDHPAAARLEVAWDATAWPTPIGRSQQPPLLTPRERQIGRLAVGGMASGAIAEQLGISGRTVDNLLGRVYAKCAVGGRRELIAVVQRERPATGRPGAAG